MRNNTFIVLMLCVLVSLLALMVVHRCTEKPSEGLETTDTVFSERTDTLWRTDTLKLVKFSVKDRVALKVDTVIKDGEIVELKTEQVKYQDTIQTIEDTVIVQSYISGINPHLDSLNLTLKKRELHTIQTVEVTNTKYKKKLFNIQPQATFGYDALNKNWGLVIGVGVGINL